MSPFTPNLSSLPGDTNNKTVNPVKKAVKLNPAHGQPGHRCDIGVGDALPENPIQSSTLQASLPQSQPIQASSDSAKSGGFNPQHGLPGHRCDIAVGAPLNSKANTDTASPGKVLSSGQSIQAKSPINPAGAGLNPQHGQPGHRCDIGVGAPLNSKPQTPEQKLPVQSTNQTPIQAKSTDTASIAKGMNPKHGQPGHRCDIAVGAPLDSKISGSTTPKKDLNTNNNTQTTNELVKYPVLPSTPSKNIQVQSPATPFISTNATSNTSTAMNPKHGEPGHRCDIAVGAPLNSKPKQ